MSKAPFATLAVLLLTVALIGCPASSTGTTGPTWSVSGTITSKFQIGQSGTITIVVERIHFDEPLIFAGNQSCYTCDGIPAGPVNVTLRVMSDNWPSDGVDSVFTVNKQVQYSGTSTGTGAGTNKSASTATTSDMTFTLGGLSINGSTRIDISLAPHARTPHGK